MDSGSKIFIFGVSSVFVIIAFILFFPFVIVNAGERGVVLVWGQVQDEILDEGLTTINPISTRVKMLDVKTKKEEVHASSASKDLQTVSTTLALNYHLDANKVNLLWKETGKDYNERIIAPALQEAIKAVTARFTAEELITKRSSVKEETALILHERLLPRHIIVDELSIVNFDFSESFNAAIEAKVTAEQNALREKNRLEQIKYEAEQAVAKAKGEAEARITNAKAEAEAIRIQAQAITQQGGPEYVRLKSIERWDGKLPVNLYGSAPIPFINAQ